MLDECHYMGDEGRGTVWEEIIVSAPRDAKLVALSATVANIREIADWISLVHRPIVAITHPHRPVPLQYLVADLSGEIHGCDGVRSGRVRLLGAERDSGGYNDKGRWYTRRVVDPTVLIDELEARGWLPAIYFIFSRAGCERAMETVLAEGKPLLARGPEAGGGPRHPRGHLRDAGHRGVAAQPDGVRGPRHGGRDAPRGHPAHVKRLIETLFERGLCRVVFATETMSLGIHMPAQERRAPVADQADGSRLPQPDPQRADPDGRARRPARESSRGPVRDRARRRDGLDEMRRVVDSEPEPVKSQFKLG